MLSRIKRHFQSRSATNAVQAEFPPDFAASDISICRAVKPYTMTSNERIYSLCRATEYVVENTVKGAFVECGVWRGGSMMVVALTLLRLGITDADLYLFDTFEGMPAPGSADRNFRGDLAEALMSKSDIATAWIWAKASLKDVETNVLSTGYPRERVHFVKGKVEDTIPSGAPMSVALLRLDTDWYESTRHELEHLFPRLEDGGVLIVDDYGHWQGAKKAVDEYILEQRTPLLLNRIDYTGRIAVKQSRIRDIRS